jgi:hypothetical protein
VDDEGGGVAEGINDANEGGNVVCPDIKTAHTPLKTTVSKITQSGTVCSRNLILTVTVEKNTSR